MRLVRDFMLAWNLLEHLQKDYGLWVRFRQSFKSMLRMRRERGAGRNVNEL